MINVNQENDNTFTISWDENDPQESIFNDWTKEDFIEFFRWCAKRENAKESGEESQEDYYNSESEGKTTSKRRTKKPLELKVMNSRKIENFPWVNTFPYFLQDLTENKRCWFQCEDHVEKYVNRYNCKYKLYHYTGNASNRDQPEN